MQHRGCTHENFLGALDEIGHVRKQRVNALQSVRCEALQQLFPLMQWGIVNNDWRELLAFVVVDYQQLLDHLRPPISDDIISVLDQILGLRTKQRFKHERRMRWVSHVP